MQKLVGLPVKCTFKWSFMDRRGQSFTELTRNRRLTDRDAAGLAAVDVESIDWVESSGDYARIHCGRQTHVVMRPLHVLERLLESREFVRVHRSLLVNLQRVRELHREADGSGTAVLHDGVRLRVARGRWEALAQALQMEEL